MDESEPRTKTSKKRSPLPTNPLHEKRKRDWNYIQIDRRYMSSVPIQLLFFRQNDLPRKIDDAYLYNINAYHASTKKSNKEQRSLSLDKKSIYLLFPRAPLHRQ